MSRVLVTGGAGYVGTVLVPVLLARGHEVVVLDALWFGDALPREEPRLTVVAADLRDRAAVRATLRAHRPEAVVHLAAVSNDPCADLDPAITRSINLEATADLMRAARAEGVARFVNASSASVYGIKDEERVTEDLALEPLTLYARYKAETEAVLGGLSGPDFRTVSVRAATVCGYSPRLRLDLTVNILTHHALTRGAIRVFGGAQQRPNVHVEDLADLYAFLLEVEPELIDGRAFNVCAANATVMALAEMVRGEIDPALEIRVEPTDDPRSYRLCADRLEAELGFRARRPLALAVAGLRDAYRDGRVADPEAPVHRNVEWMKRHPEWWRLARRAS